jgi:hypothetical protein
MSHGGRAWRGYFPVGGELTSGEPDLKEGLYFGTELDESDPRVRAGTPMHGRNLFPTSQSFERTVLDYMSALEAAGQRRVVTARGRGCGSMPTISSVATPAIRPCCSGSSAIRPMTLRERRWGVGARTRIMGC